MRKCFYKSGDALLRIQSIHLRWTVSPSLDVKETGLDESTEQNFG